MLDHRRSVEFLLCTLLMDSSGRILLRNGAAKILTKVYAQTDLWLSESWLVWMNHFPQCFFRLSHQPESNPTLEDRKIISTALHLCLIKSSAWYSPVLTAHWDKVSKPLHQVAVKFHGDGVQERLSAWWVSRFHVAGSFVVESIYHGSLIPLTTGDQKMPTDLQPSYSIQNNSHEVGLLFFILICNCFLC